MLMERHACDAVVVGAGVVGLAVAMALARAGRAVVVLDAAPAIGTGISSRNSEVVHAGLYYPPDSLKARLCVAGNRALHAWCGPRGVPLRATGKLVVATDDAEAAALEGFAARAAANGAPVALIDGAAARALEPALACVAAMASPSTAIIDSHALMLSYLAEAEAHGATLALATPVLGGEALPGGAGVALRCGGADPMILEARTVVIAAGLHAAAVARAIEGVRTSAVPALRYAKGSYFDLAGRPPFSRLIYPLPVAGGLGVHYTVDLAGRGRFGPDVEWLDTTDPDRIDYAVDPGRGAAFLAAVRRYWPGLPDGALAPAYSGVRPKLGGPADPAADFRLLGPEESGVDGLFTLLGIESPGLTASLPLGEHVAAVVAGH